VTYDAFDVVVVPFPFTDRAQTKRRPALVLSNAKQFNTAIGHSVMAMITSAGKAHWPLDIEVRDLRAAGLPAPSLVRMKLFTLDHRFVSHKAGQLTAPDRRRVREALKQLFPAGSTP
jgi:mRNA interferase MazF